MRVPETCGLLLLVRMLNPHQARNKRCASVAEKGCKLLGVLKEQLKRASQLL